MGVNKVFLLGNIGKDPDIRTFESGAKAAQFTLATSERVKDKSGEWSDKVEWHNIVVLGGQVEVIEKYTKKGSKLFIEGRLATRSWESNGIKKYITEVIASRIELLDKKEESKGAAAPKDDDLPW